jgi:hypothetical protein
MYHWTWWKHSEVNIEFAKRLEDPKCHLDHRKILREPKIINDLFYRDPHLKARHKRSMQVHCIQITWVEGQVVGAELVDNGLYEASTLGSLRLLTPSLDLFNARTSLERSYTLKARQYYTVLTVPIGAASTVTCVWAL